MSDMQKSKLINLLSVPLTLCHFGPRNIRMKKFPILTLVALMVFAFALPAAALENVFGIYGQTQAYTIGNFNGRDNDATNLSLVDSGTRLDYTTILHNNLKRDVDYYSVAPTFDVSNMLTLTPYVMYVTPDNENSSLATPGSINIWNKLSGNSGLVIATGKRKVNLYYLGVDADVNLGSASLWFTGIYQAGNIKEAEATATPIREIDFNAWLAAIGANLDLEIGDIHGQLFFAAGDETKGNNNIKAFNVPAGLSYCWSGVMGYGLFDDLGDVGASYSADFPGNQNSNVTAINIGSTIKTINKLTVNFDLWCAKFKKSDANKKNQVSTEVDLTITYELMEGLNIGVVAAYLFAGDSTYAGSDEANPYELGTRLSLSF